MPRARVSALKEQPAVQKYGGSSLSTLEKVREVARKIVDVHDAGRPVVTVVSAMGNTTSQLVAKAREISSAPSRREMDMLLSSGERVSMALLTMAIQSLGRPAISLTGPQSGIVTDEAHADATIVDVRPDRIRAELAAGRIVIVAGYQGATPSGEITTLGRGGSDTTAVALAGALGASCCEIYSDVAGVYTADPRVVEDALHLRRVGPLLMAEYARHGARVLHAPCLEHARSNGVAIRAGSTFGSGRSTLIGGDSDVEYSSSRARDAAFRIVGVASRPAVLRVCSHDADADRAVAILEELEQLNTFREVPSSVERTLDVIIDAQDVRDPESLTTELSRRLDGIAEVEGGLSSVSAVADTRRTDDLPERVGRAFDDARIDVVSTYRHPLSITYLVRPEQRLAAVRSVHASLVGSESEAFAV